jgi:hypothetical protein
MKILAIGSEAADLERSCGSTLEKFAREGHRVSVIIAKDLRPSKPNREVLSASANKVINLDESSNESVGVVEFFGRRGIHEVSFVSDFDYSEITQRNGDLLHEHVSKFKPELVIIPFWKSNDDASRVLARSALIACRGIGSILMYGDRAQRDSLQQLASNVTFQMTSTLSGNDSTGVLVGEHLGRINLTSGASVVMDPAKRQDPDANREILLTESFESHRLLLLHEVETDWL